MVDEYVNQSGALYSIFMRFSDAAMRKRNRPVKVHGSNEKSALVHAVEGDIATAIFMILDDTEKYGWNDRNSKREYFAHSEALIAQERSLIRVIELLRLPIPESIRIGVVIEYDTLKKAATMFMRRAGVLLTDICNRYITRNTAGEDTNYIIQFEEMLADEKFFEYSQHPKTNHYYGTPLPEIEKLTKKTHIARHQSMRAARRQRSLASVIE